MKIKMGLWGMVALLSLSQVAAGETEGKTEMSESVKGTFQVQMTPAETESPAGRFMLDKTYEGPLSGAGVGEMLTAMTATKGSQAYVAVEKVTGALNGHEGSFMIIHRGVMDKGAPTLSIEIVPDSGEGALEGISGTMDIQMEEGKHHYVLNYLLP